MRALARASAAVAAALLAASTFLLRGRGEQPPPLVVGVPAATVTAPTNLATDYRDPTRVCVRFAAAVHRHDTRTDAGPQDAYRRAAAYLTGELAAAVAAQPEGRDPRWATWRAHRAATIVTAAAQAAAGDDRPADTATEAYRAARVTVTPVGADGWRGPIEQRLVWCTLRRAAPGWRVEDYQLVKAELQ